VNPKAVPHGGPAFPVPGLQHDEAFNGLSIRDYFAAKALQQTIGRCYAIVPDEAPMEDVREAVCDAAYAWADAMLKARAK